MAMEPKTLATILDEANDYHRRLVAHLKQCAEHCESEREAMLLHFVVEHEQWLASSLAGLELRQRDSALNTWFYEYTDRHEILFSDPSTIHFEYMPYNEICEKLRTINNEIIDLFEHLRERAENKDSEEALRELTSHLAANAKNLAQETANTEGL